MKQKGTIFKIQVRNFMKLMFSCSSQNGILKNHVTFTQTLMHHAHSSSGLFDTAHKIQSACVWKFLPWSKKIRLVKYK
jgi:hypothetical protein